MIKRTAVALGLMLLLASSARGAISFDAASSVAGAATTFNWSHTCSGNDRLLIVKIHYNDNTLGCEIISATYNAVAMTQIFCTETDYQLGVAYFHLVAPATGANTITVNKSGSLKATMGAISLNGVHQSDPVPTNSSNVDTSADAGPSSLNITTQYADSWIAGSCGLGTDNEYPAVNSGQTSRWNNQTTGAPDAGNQSVRGSSEAVTTAQLYADSYDWTGVYKHSEGVIEVREAPPPTATATPTWTSTATPTHTETATRTITLTATETATSTMTLTDTETATKTRTVSWTPTHTKTWTKTSTETATPTATPSVTTSSTPTVTATATPTPRYQDWNRLYWRGAVATGGGGLAAGTVALLSMENDVVDTAGTYTWTNVNSVAFSNTIFVEGSYSADYRTSASRCIHSSSNITETIKTIEFYLYTLNAGGVDRRVYNTSLGNDPIVQANGLALRYFLSGWSATYNLPAWNTWYHITLIVDNGAGGSELFVDNVQRITKASTAALTNTVHHIGNYNTDALGCYTYIDFVRLSNIVQPGPYPTTD